MIVSVTMSQIIMDLVFYIFLYVIFLSVVSKSSCFHKKLLSFEISSKIFHEALLLDVC